MKAIYSAMDILMRASQPGIVGTVIIGHPEVCPSGIKFVVNDQGVDLVGNFPSDILALLQEDIQAVLVEKTPRVLEMSCEYGLFKIFLDPLYLKTKLIVLGGGHIAQPLVTIGHLLGFHVTVVDDRPSFANVKRFPEANQVVCRDFPSTVRDMAYDTNTYVVIVTRGHRHDKTCLAGVLRVDHLAYVGMIGSKRKVKTLFDELMREGFTKDQLDSVYAPIGLDIGAQTPQEIALSIMAEIIMVSRYGYSHGLKTRQGGTRVEQ